MRFLVLLMCLTPLLSLSYEKADAFIIRANPFFFKVLSPVKVKKKIGLIVENKTLTKIIGKLVSDSLGDIEMISIEVGKKKAIEFKYNKNDTFYFVPLSPPFQKIELKAGEKSYEVPPQRKDK